MGRRLILLLAVAAIAAAAPVRAWCEATCLAPSETASHCPSHESGDQQGISVNTLDECPVLDSARPAASARLDVQPVAIGSYAPALVARTHVAPSSLRRHHATTVFERSTPLRI